MCNARYSADEHVQTSGPERGNRHSPRPAGGLDSAEAARGLLELDAPPSAVSIRLPEGPAPKVSAQCGELISGHLRGIGPGPGTWKDPDPRRWSSRGSGAQN